MHDPRDITIEINNDRARNILTALRESLTQYGALHLIEGGDRVCTLVRSLATVLSFLDPSVRIVTNPGR
jgi:hypothetical protein